MKRWLLAAALALVGAAAQAQRAPDHRFCGPNGGNVEDCRQLANVTAARQGIVALGPRCKSGCTMQLNAPNICVRPDAVLSFHAAQYTQTFAISRLGNETLMAHYQRFPKLVRELRRVGALERFEFTDYSAVDLRNLGVPICRGQQ
jgi:hypothetical protein